MESSHLCGRGWQHRLLLKSSRRPVFEGEWNCGEDCLRERVQRALRREGKDASVVRRTHAHRVPLGLLLLSEGVITQQELQRARSAQEDAGYGRIGAWIGEVCNVDESAITRCLALQWGVPVFSTLDFEPVAMKLVAPQEILRSAEAVPLRVTESHRLQLAFAENIDASAAFALERMSGLRVESGFVSPSELATCRRHLEEAEGCELIEESVEDKNRLEHRITQTIQYYQPRESRLVRVHHLVWLRMWLEDATLLNGRGVLPTSPEDVCDVLFRLDVSAPSL